MDEITKININAYNSDVDNYYERNKELSLEQMNIRQEFMSKIKQSGKILDLGCGPGRDSKIFSEKGFKVLGIDLSPRMILKAKQVAPNAEFKIRSFLNLDFENENFDGIWFEEGLPCIRKGYAPQLIKNIIKILKKGGIFYVSVNPGTGEGFIFDKHKKKKMYWAYYTIEEIRNLLESHNFDVEKIHRFTKKSQNKDMIGIVSKKKFF